MSAEPVKQYLCFDGAKIQTRDAFFKKFASYSFVPEYFSPNLDAVWDVISDTTLGNFEFYVLWLNTDMSASSMADGYYQKIELLFNDAQEDNKIRLEWNPYNSVETKELNVQC